VRRDPPDLVLLDIGLPGMDGLDALQHLRRESEVPVIYLTARRREMDQVLGLGLGADDYITKPFDIDVLLAHIKAVLRRARATPVAGPQPLVVGDLTIDPAAHTVTVAGRAVALSPREFDLLHALALEAAVLLCRNLYTAYRHGNNREVREKMALGSLLAGIALNNARPGAVHGLAHPVGIRYRVPHGLVCAILLPYVMEYNLIFGEEKYAKIAKALGLVEPETPATAAARRLLSFVIALRERLKIPAKLKDVGLSREDLPFLVEAALPSGSLAANPRAAGYADLMKILETNL
jgi:ActR/RegA family two-component response regulator